MTHRHSNFYKKDEMSGGFYQGNKRLVVFEQVLWGNRELYI
jgi:hypothetical protein